MKPRIPAGAPAVPAVTRALWEEFQYPRTVVPPFPVSGGGGGGAPTVVVAAADAHPIEKAKADYICTGSADQVTIEAAVGLLHGLSASRGGRILLTSGTFACNADIQVVDKIFLQGMGRYETIIHTTQAAGNFIGLGTDGGLRDLTVMGTSATVPSGALVETYNTGNLIENVLLSRGATGIVDTGGGETTVVGCNSELVPLFFDGSAGSAAVTITRSIVNAAGHGIGNINIGPAGNSWLITNNMMGGQITTTPGGVAGVVISDNVWTDVAGPEDFVVYLESVSSLVFANNSLPDADGYDFLHLYLCSGAVVAGNTADDLTAGIRVELCDNALIIGNVLGAGGTGYLGGHGIHVIGGESAAIIGNSVYKPGQDTNNTFDGIILADEADRAVIFGNRVTLVAGGNQPRYGINISTADCTDNIYAGNTAGPSASFGTGAYNDAGTGTANTWPGAGAPQGDNFIL